MLAGLQRILTLSGLTIAIAWSAALVVWEEPAWTYIGPALVVFAQPFVLAIEFVLLAVVQRTQPGPEATLIELLRAWCGEVGTAFRVFCWRQPFRSRAESDNLPGAVRIRGVVFVHGFFCNRGMWNPWMKRLRPLGVPFIAINLEPAFAPIDVYVPAIDAAVARVQDATGLAPLIVAHSMGGLAVRAWLRDERDGRRVHRIVTVGSPHRGAWMARFGRTRNARQMAIGSRWLDELGSGEADTRKARFTCFYGSCDNIVFPAFNATLPGADNRYLRAAAHLRMTFHGAVFDEVLRHLK